MKLGARPFAFCFRARLDGNVRSPFLACLLSFHHQFLRLSCSSTLLINLFVNAKTNFNYSDSGYQKEHGFKVLIHFRRLKIRQFWIIFFSVPLIYIYMKLFSSCKYMFVEYKQIFILNFRFMAQIQRAPKSNIKKKIWRMASLASLSAPTARDSIVALRAPFFLDLALRARSCALRIRLSLFLII